MGHGRRRGTVRLSLRRVDEISTSLSTHDTWLSTPELQRLQSLKTASRRSQFLAGHWLARHAAALWLGGNWSAYQLSAPEDAAPGWLAGPADVDWQRLCVSLSHSGNWVACALAFQPVGVDVECSQQARDFAALAHWIFSDTELHGFLQMAPEAQQQHFYAQWTLKEAWVKQAGTAPVKRAMQATRFELGVGASPALLAQTDELTLAVYPARMADAPAEDPLLKTMQWSEWACTPPR